MLLRKSMYNGHKSYLENEVLSADPLKLVVLLYRGALDAIHSARQHLAKREIRERSKAITKAQLIVLELAHSLDLEKGGNLATELARLYQYIGQRLVDANIHQQDAPLAEAGELLSTLLEAWEPLLEACEHCAPPVPAAEAAGELSYSY
jgi:flagellar protein FliS